MRLFPCLLLFAASLLLEGCPLETTFPAKDPATCTSDDFFIGSWTTGDTLAIAPRVEFRKLNEHECMLHVLRPGKNFHSVIFSYKASVFAVQGKLLLQAHALEDRNLQKWYFFLIEKKGTDTINVLEVSGELVHKYRAQNPEALLKQISELVANGNAWGRAAVYTRDRLPGIKKK